MKHGVTFDQNGQVIPHSFHVPHNFAHLPYVPHPLQLVGLMDQIPVLGLKQIPQAGASQTYQQSAQRR
jgi:hypothetical protein